ncbi:MAG: hypothetical protein J0H39_13935 [Alphaproteobacteria bacterium]|nr:hypothetical protein [Alphaproteobacteria bacterium]
MTDMANAPDNPAATDALASQGGAEPELHERATDDHGDAGGDSGEESLADAAQAAADEGLEDFEHEGKTYKVPKELKDGYLRQADYTRKTQEVAEFRKSHEAEKAAFAAEQRVLREFNRDMTEIAVMDRDLARFDQIDWNRWAQEDPAACNAAIAQRQTLMNQRASKVSEIARKADELEGKQRKAQSERAANVQTEIRKLIPDWSEAKARELTTFGKELGYSTEELQAATPRDVQTLHEAMQWRRHIAKQRAAAKAVAPPVVEPAPTPKAGTGRAAPQRGPSDGDSIDAWMAKRNKQVAGR